MDEKEIFLNIVRLNENRLELKGQYEDLLSKLMCIAVNGNLMDDSIKRSIRTDMLYIKTSIDKIEKNMWLEITQYIAFYFEIDRSLSYPDLPIEKIRELIDYYTQVGGFCHFVIHYDKCSIIDSRFDKCLKALYLIKMELIKLVKVDKAMHENEKLFGIEDFSLE